ncbi:MAG: hypothetical protein CMN29_28725 [Sandaracinus sp.]|nr:hypothetical protein [Sandaracinus sp.]
MRGAFGFFGFAAASRRAACSARAFASASASREPSFVSTSNEIRPSEPPDSATAAAASAPPASTEAVEPEVPSDSSLESFCGGGAG